MKRLSFAQRRWVVYSRRVFRRHRRLIGVFVAGAIIIAVFPILLIPVFGIALPAYGAWITYNSFLEDKRKDVVSHAVQQRVETILRKSITDKLLINLPLKDGNYDRIGYVKEFDADDITLIDQNNSEFLISWRDIDLDMFYSRFGGQGGI